MRNIICFIALLCLTACGKSNWADVTGPLGPEECKDGKPPENMLTGDRSDPSYMKNLGAGTCMMRQKNYSGEFRCKGDKLQVKCED